MRKSKQLEFEGFYKPKLEFGGSKLKGNARSKRPLSSKLPIHLTLRSNYSCMRKGKAFAQVDTEIYRTAKKYGVRIYRYANVGNHLHLLIRVTKLPLWAAFIRVLAGRIAQLMGMPDKFWMFKPHTRIIQGWKKAFNIVKSYIYLNQIEAEGFINRKETKTLKDLQAIFDG